MRQERSGTVIPVMLQRVDGVDGIDVDQCREYKRNNEYDRSCIFQTPLPGSSDTEGCSCGMAQHSGDALRNGYGVQIAR